MRHRGSPCVKDCGDADARAEVFAISGDGQHRLRCCFEQQIVDERLVLEGDVGDLGRQREHDVEIANWKQIGLAVGQPRPRGRALTLRAVPVATGVVGDAPVPAILAGFDVAAERCGAAVLDRRHDLDLGEAQVPGMGGPVGRPCGTENIGGLYRVAHGSAVGPLAFHQRHQPVERPRNRVDRPGGDLGVERGRLELAVSEQNLNDPDVGAVLQKVGGKAVP